MANPSWRSGLGLLGRDSPSSRLNLGPRPGASPSSHWQPLAGTTSGTRPYQGGAPPGAAAAPAGRPYPYAYSPRAYPPPPVNPGIPSPRQWPDSGASRPPNELQRPRDAVAAAVARVSQFERLSPQAAATRTLIPRGPTPPWIINRGYKPVSCSLDNVE
ncbi:hypothetical protein DIPPA_21181 [Diplonema papillatum]|nr:hypothetical protein DIPPA_21181 [Diplonema papillatum]